MIGIVVVMVMYGFVMHYYLIKILDELRKLNGNTNKDK